MSQCKRCESLLKAAKYAKAESRSRTLVWMQERKDKEDFMIAVCEEFLARYRRARRLRENG